jgi:DNA-binding NarL/FixJ family response regulator
MICWECKGREAEGATLCECCKAEALAEGRHSARVRRTTRAERELMQALRAQGLTCRAVADVVGRSLQTVQRHTR